MAIDRRVVDSEVRYVQTAWSALANPISNAVADEVANDIVQWAARTRPLERSETAVVTLLKPKTSALLVDRVWIQWAGEDPQLDFAFAWESPMAIRLAALFAFQHLTATKEERESWQQKTAVAPETEQFVVANERELALDYCARTGASVVPLYDSAQSREAQYKAGNAPTIVSIVENLDVVDEESLTWEQVREFREDASARAAYRRFIHWLDKDMTGKSVAYIVDEVGARLERYDWAIRKHGMNTVLGALERTLDAKSLIGASAVILTAQSLSHDSLLSLLGAGGILIGKVGVTAALKLIERADIRDAHRDIAFVHEVKSRLGAS